MFWKRFSRFPCSVLKGFRKRTDTVVEQEELLARFELRERFLVDSELSLYQSLNQAIADKAIVCPKPRVLEALRVLNAAAHLEDALRIDRKHVDFLVCDRNTGHPLCAVQIDWWDDGNEDYRPREPLLEQAFSLAGLPVIHVPSDPLPSHKDLRNQLDELVGSALGAPILRNHPPHPMTRPSDRGRETSVTQGE